MFIDLIYNSGVRHLFRGPPLPPTPKPRRFSYLISTSSLAGAALSFYYGLPVLGFIQGSGCHRGHDSRHYALVSRIVDLQDNFRACRGKVGVEPMWIVAPQVADLLAARAASVSPTGWPTTGPPGLRWSKLGPPAAPPPRWPAQAATATSNAWLAWSAVVNAAHWRSLAAKD